MERASKLIRRLDVAAASISADDLAAAAWPNAVGKKIAAHTRAARLVRTRLVVEVEDAVWQRQLFSLTPHILKNFDRIVGPGMVEDFEFRIIPRRRQPQQATAAVPAANVDEADEIADPILRGIYRAARKRAQA